MDYILDEKSLANNIKLLENSGKYQVYAAIVDDVLDDYEHPVSISEIGCGIALLSGVINSEGVSYVGYDINPLSISLCKSRFPDKHFIKQDVRKYCDKVDIIMAFAFLKHFSLEEAPAVLRILCEYSQQLIFSMPIGESDVDDLSNGWPHTFVTRKTLEGWLKSGNHTIVSTDDKDVENIFVTKRVAEAKEEHKETDTASTTPKKKSRKKRK